MRTKILVFCLLLVLFGSGMAMAQGVPRGKPLPRDRAMAPGGMVGISVLGGGAWATDSDPLEGRDGYTGPDSSSFDGTWTLGAEALWRFRPGISFGLGVQHWNMVAQAARTGGSESDFISAKETPVYALVRFGVPMMRRAFIWHAEAGAGMVFNSPDKEEGLSAMEAGIGEAVNLDMDNAFGFFLGIGLDYFFTPRTSLGLSLRHWWTEADYDMSSATLGTIERGSINGDNFQALVNVTWWF